MSDIPLPTPPNPQSTLPAPLSPDIFSYGFDKSINKPIKSIESSLAYNPISDGQSSGAIYSGNLVPGGDFNLTNANILNGGIVAFTEGGGMTLVDTTTPPQASSSIIVAGSLALSNANALTNQSSAVAIGGTDTPISVSVTTVSSHFQKILTGGPSSSTIWGSDTTTPNGNLSGNSGDICLNGTGGHLFYCTGTINWTQI